LPERPIFVINATNVQSGVLWRFTRRYVEDYRVGTIEARTFQLAEAVAASSAFPPFLSPVVLRTNPADYKPGSGLDLQRRPFTSRSVLIDGGVYDNLGLETAWKKLRTVLVSDGGGRMREQADPKPDWYSQLRRAYDMTDNQVRALRKQQLIDSYVAGLRTGAYWGINTNIAHYQLDDVLDCPVERTTALARVSTRLAALDDRTQERLINWGYAVCDAAIRRHFDPSQPAPTGFPYPDAPV
jgi:NTE family protein